MHEVIYFAEIMHKGGEDLELSVAIAQAVIPLEQTLNFRQPELLKVLKCSQRFLL